LVSRWEGLGLPELRTRAARSNHNCTTNLRSFISSNT